MTRTTIATAAALVALSSAAVMAGAPDALAQGEGSTMMGGQYQGGWHGHGGWLWGARGVLSALLMVTAIAALVALTRYLWRLGDRVGSS